MPEISWIKLKTTMFDDEKIRLIQAVPEADAILVIWIRLLVLAGKTNDSGLIYIQRNMPYTEEMLATLFDKPLNTVRLALQTLASFSMIDLNSDGVMAISNWDKHQNVEGLEKIREQNRLRAKRYYDKNKKSNVSLTLDVTQSNATDIDKELDKELDKEEKNIYIDQFEFFWSKYPKKTQKKKAAEQFKKKIKVAEDLQTFRKGFVCYLKYIEINNDWYNPQEFFRWIRDERYKDEYDLSEKKSKKTLQRRNNRIEELPDHISDQSSKKDDVDVLLEADKIIEERRKHEGL